MCRSEMVLKMQYMAILILQPYMLIMKSWENTENTGVYKVQTAFQQGYQDIGLAILQQINSFK
jgi:hypothetical protein